jgi:hypothetical protein
VPRSPREEGEENIFIREDLVFGDLVPFEEAAHAAWRLKSFLIRAGNNGG